MREFQERNKLKKRIYSKVTVAILCVVVLLMAHGVYDVYQKEQESKLEVVQAEKQKDQLTARYDSLSQDSADLQTQDGVEAEIRDKFDVIKPGEGVIVVVSKPTPTIQPDNRSVLKKFWDSVVSVFRGKSSTSSGQESDGQDVTNDASST